MTSFQTSTRFLHTASIVNKIPLDKLPFLLERIIKTLHVKHEKPFSVDEEEQLKELLGYSNQELRMVLDCLSYIFEQSAFTSTGPESLFETLLNAGFDDPHAKAIGRMWAAEGSDYVNKLKDQSLGFQTLTSVDYHLNMVVGQNDLTRQQEPISLFEFEIDQKAEHSSTDSKEQEKKQERFCVELNHSELYDLFLQLERMQQQLDNLGKQG